MVEPIWGWFLFLAFIFLLLYLDLKVIHGEAHEIGLKEASIWSLFWILLALIFNVLIYFWLGSQKAFEYFTGYLLEKSLSVDNVFVFSVILNYFLVPPKNRHKLLFFGILGAIFFRLLFILLGTYILHLFSWVIYIFAAIVLYSGYSLLMRKKEKIKNPSDRWLIKWAKKRLPLVDGYVDSRFIVKKEGKFYFTPMIIALLAIETTDIAFALDSIPAIFAITRDPFIIFTSNVFAILGLRALYFVVEGFIKLFRYLEKGLSIILIFIGLKMIINEAFHPHFHVPLWLSLLFLLVVLSFSITLSLIKNSK